MDGLVFTNGPFPYEWDLICSSMECSSGIFIGVFDGFFRYRIRYWKKIVSAERSRRKSLLHRLTIPRGNAVLVIASPH